MLVLGLGSLLALAAAACEADGTTSGGTSPTAATPEATKGALVTVTGTVEEVFADRAFTLTDATAETGSLETPGDVAVIVGDGDAQVTESERVVVTGTLHSIDVADQIQELEELFGVQIDEEALERFQGQHLIVASRVEASA
jgi:acyl carrier protein